MAVLVAGGCGYIGSHICKLLEKRGYEVVVIDNLSHGYRDFARFGPLVEADIADVDALDAIFSKFDIQAVMHFSAFIEVGESCIAPDKYYWNNVAGTLSLINSMRKNNVDKLIFSSTAAVYGTPLRVPIGEEDQKLPINPYGSSKLMVEKVLEDLDAAFGFKSIRFRYFNASGCDPDGDIGEAHVPETHLIPLVLDAAFGTRENVKIYGTDYDTKDGTCIRDYVHVNDIANAHIIGLEMLLRDFRGTMALNLGSGEGFTVREIVEAVKRITGKDFEVVETGRRKGDPEALVANSTKARELLGWKPEFSLDEIIETAWIWHQKLKTLSLR